MGSKKTKTKPKKEKKISKQKIQKIRKSQGRTSNAEGYFDKNILIKMFFDTE